VLSEALVGAFSGVRCRSTARDGARSRSATLRRRSAALVDAFAKRFEAPEKRFFLAMGENGPYSETSFY
jgi:hypothetical protein